jgi:hypothetical protein
MNAFLFSIYLPPVWVATSPLRHGETRRNRDVSGPAEDLAFCKEPIFFWFHGMCFHLNNILACEGEDSLQSIGRLKRRECEQEVRKVVPATQETVYKPTVHAITESLLPRLKCKVSPHDGTGR